MRLPLSFLCSLCFLLFNLPVFAAITRVDVGASPNDMTGDRIRRAFQIINTNLLNLDSQFGTITNLLTVPDMATLRTMPATNTTTGYQLIGYLTANDRGGGVFYVNPLGIEEDNLGTIITPTNNVGRLVRRLDNTDVYPEWFGGVVNNATVQAAINYVSARGYGTVWITGDYAIDPVNSPITMRSNVSLVGAPGGGFHFEGLQTASWALLTVPAGVTNGSIANLKLRGRLEVPGSTNNTGYLIRLGSVTNFTIGGIQARDWYSGYFAPFHTVAFENLQIFDQDWADTVRGYGAIGDGFTDDTKAVQNCTHHKQTIEGRIFFPPGTYSLSSVWITNGAVAISGDGRAVLKQRYDNPDIGVYERLSGIFMIMAHNTTIEGLKFTQAGLFPAIEIENVTGVCPPININLATNVTIRNCNFDVPTGKAISSSGDFTRILNNTFSKCGFTFGTGVRDNWLYYQAPYGPAEAVHRSPQSPLVQGNTFVGSSVYKHLCFFSGTPGFNFSDNTILDADTPTSTLQIYSGDTGVHDKNGTNIYEVSGIISGNTITGSFGTDGAIRVTLATPTNYVPAGFDVSLLYSSLIIQNNHISGTGPGISLTKANGTKVLNNDVRVTGNALKLYGNCDGIVIDGGYYWTAGAGDFGASIVFGDAYLALTNFKNVKIRNATFDCAPASEYWMRNVAPLFVDSFTVENCDIYAPSAGSGDTPAVFQLTLCTNFVSFINNRFYTTNSMDDRRLGTLSGTYCDFTWDQNKIISLSSDINRRGPSISGRTVRYRGNDTGSGEFSNIDELILSDNLLTYGDGIITLNIEEGVRLATIYGNRIYAHNTTSQVAVWNRATNSTFYGNLVRGNSGSDIVMSLGGKMFIHNNLILNAGVGFTFPTAAESGTLSDDIYEHPLHVNQGSDAGDNLLLERAGSFNKFGLLMDGGDANYFVRTNTASYLGSHNFWARTTDGVEVPVLRLIPASPPQIRFGDTTNSPDFYLGRVLFKAGDGSPESVVPAPTPSIYFNTNGTGGLMYVKTNGVGSTGWLAVH